MWLKRSLAGFLPYGLVVGANGCRGSVEHLLNGSKADVESQNGGAKGLNHAAAISLVAGHLGNDATEVWTKSGPVLSGNHSFVHLSTAATSPFVENEVKNVGLDGWKEGQSQALESSPLLGNDWTGKSLPHGKM
jgi:hypothetical protein